MIDVPTSGCRIAAARFVIPAIFLLLPFIQVHAQTRHAPELLDVIALRVEFQPDTTRFTTGNGTFAGPLFEGVEPPSIDPLPHDAAYFDAHLRFLENYIDHVSDGRTHVRTHLLPDVVQVSGTMGEYSPTGPDSDSDAERAKMVALIDEAWTNASLNGLVLPSDLDPEHTAFVLFHAGVGRDIELVGTSLDKTPEDLPSIFFSEEVLDRLGVSDLSVDGLDITNTMVIPRTESRLGFNFLTDEPFLIELSINGMLAASFLNYLGVPDLFNTSDGESAIGPFGVMDALGIFAFSGLFPPEPSAWTKHYLGWADRIEVGLGQEVSLRASGQSEANDVAYVPISDAEYFLVENRHRDPGGDGVNLRVWTRDGEQTVHFDNADPDFNDQTVSGFPGGVVIGVDDYDFVLPGGVDENDNPLMGGILIWHVDENRLSSTIAANAVNADRNARSIDLEEADGAQDIGYNSGGGFFGPSFNLGTPFDFWYEGNPVTVRTNSGQDIRLYENRFGPDTTPSNTSNGGAIQGFELRDFSPPGPVMTFSSGAVETVGPELLAEWVSPSGVEFELAPLGQSILFASQNVPGFWVWGPRTDGAWRASWRWPSEQVDSSVLGKNEMWPGEGLPVRPAFSDTGVMLLTQTSFHLLTGWDGGFNGEEIRFQPNSNVGVFSEFSPRMAWTGSSSDYRFYVGAMRDGLPVLLTLSLNENGSQVIDSRPAPSRILDILVINRSSHEVLIVTEDGLLNASMSLQQPFDVFDYVSTALFDAFKTPEGIVTAWASADRHRVYLVNEDGVQRTFDVDPTCEVTNPMFHQVDRDGIPDLVFACGSKITALHASGAVHDGFPVNVGVHVQSQPVVAQVSSGDHVLMAATASGGLVAYRTDGGAQPVSGFPLSIGKAAPAAPHFTAGAVSATTALVGIRSWEFASTSARNVSDSDLILSVASNGTQPQGNALLVAEETYNWPNPITEGETRIRFAVREASDVEIDIVDMGGVLVDNMLLSSVQPGLPQEVLWNTEAGSGIYLARVRAKSLSGGKEESRIIRMAIIR